MDTWTPSSVYVWMAAIGIKWMWTVKDKTFGEHFLILSHKCWNTVGHVSYRGTGRAGWGLARWPTERAAEALAPDPPSSVRHAVHPRCCRLLCESPPGTQREETERGFSVEQTAAPILSAGDASKTNSDFWSPDVVWTYFRSELCWTLDCA